MSRSDTKQAEKEYLSRTGSSEWERVKPFSQPGTDTLVESARLLQDDGVALFSEPGKGHADAPVSTAAVRDFGVLEQEVLIPEFFSACHEAGFRDVRLKPMSYSLPELDLTLKQWNAWTRAASSKRPVRALGKMRRAVAEFFGVGKEGPLFEEAFGITAVRVLRGAMEAHPVIVAAKSPQVLERGAQYAAAILDE